jgi:hypothetical protein
MSGDVLDDQQVDRGVELRRGQLRELRVPPAGLRHRSSRGKDRASPAAPATGQRQAMRIRHWRRGASAIWLVPHRPLRIAPARAGSTPAPVCVLRRPLSKASRTAKAWWANVTESCSSLRSAEVGGLRRHRSSRADQQLPGLDGPGQIVKKGERSSAAGTSSTGSRANRFPNGRRRKYSPGGLGACAAAYAKHSPSGQGPKLSRPKGLRDPPGRSVSNERISHRRGREDAEKKPPKRRVASFPFYYQTVALF